MRPAMIKVRFPGGVSEYSVQVHHTEGGWALAELRDDVPGGTESWIPLSRAKGEVVTIPLTAIRFTD